MEEEAVHAQTRRRLVRGVVVEDVAECSAEGVEGGLVASIGHAVGVHRVGVAGGGDDGVRVVRHSDLGAGDGGEGLGAALDIGEGRRRARGEDADGVGRCGGVKASLCWGGEGVGGGG
eukprot:scaffold22200_cov30-Phaeocystis_antarctica.AAC.1